MRGGRAALALLLAAHAAQALLQGAKRWGELTVSQDAAEKDKWPRVACSKDEEAMKQKAVALEETYGPRMREVMAKLDSPAYLTVSGGYLKPLANYLVHLQQVGIAEGRSMSAVSVMMDQTGIDACRAMERNLGAMSMVCLDLTGWIDTYHEPHSYPYQYWWAKPVIYKLAVESSNHGVMLTDLDVVIYQDLIDYTASVFRKHEDIAIACSSELGNFNWNTGIMYAEKKSLPVLQLWVQENHCYFQKEFGDQSAINSVFNRNMSQLGSGAMRVYTFPRSVVNQLCVKGTHAGHYNCIEKQIKGVQGVMMDGEDWVDADDLLTNHSQP